jgi:hypothetical protein
LVIAAAVAAAAAAAAAAGIVFLPVNLLLLRLEYMSKVEEGMRDEKEPKRRNEK